MSTRQTRTPIDLLLHNLAARPPGGRTVLVLDPDRLIEWSRSVTDAKGRLWEVVIYRGDDVITRQTWQKAWATGHSICLVLSRADGDEGALDVSYLADILGRKEGDIVDLTLTGYFHTLFPRVNPPEPTLRQYRREFVENVQGFVRAYPKLKDRWGEPDAWTRGQFLATLLLSRCQELALTDIWCDEVEPARFAAHAAWLLCHPQFELDELRIVADLMWESSPRFSRGDEMLAWLAVPAHDLEDFRNELAGYLVLRDTLAGRGVEHLDSLLGAKLAFTALAPDEIGGIAPAITATLKQEDRWDAIVNRAGQFLTPTRVKRAADLMSDDPIRVAELIGSPDTPLPVVGYFVRQALLQHLREGAIWPSWVDALEGHPLLRWRPSQPALTPADSAIAAFFTAALDFAAVESLLTTSVPAFERPEQLLDWYVANRLYMLDYRVADALAKLQSVDDAELQGPAFAYVMNAPDGLRFRVRELLNKLDEQLARFVAADPQKFMYGPRSAIKIIPNVLRRTQRRDGERVWVLVMDGMRYDTWDAVVRPLLVEHFEVVGQQDRAFFSLLPSKTDIARRGLLAAGLGRDWKNFFQRPTKDERVLAAKALGLKNEDLAERIAFITDAETTEAREKLRVSAESRDVNVLIYPVSDDLGHYHNDTLASLNDKIRQQLLNHQGRRGIVDDLRRRVGTNDVVLVVSDHGFQELFAEEQVPVTRLDAREQGGTEDDVVYRYLRFPPPPSVSDRTHLTVNWEEHGPDGRKQTTRFTLAVGGTWFQRERGRPARFAHGGVSLAEMCVPGVLLRPIQERAARVELLDVPSEISVNEDEPVTFSFEVVNAGNVDATYSITASTNLAEVLVNEQGGLAPGKRQTVCCRLNARCALDANRDPIPDRTTMAVILELSHSDVAGAPVRPAYGRQVVRISVRPKATKIETDALSAFDDL